MTALRRLPVSPMMRRLRALSPEVPDESDPLVARFDALPERVRQAVTLKAWLSVTESYRRYVEECAAVRMRSTRAPRWT